MLLTKWIVQWKHALNRNNNTRSFKQDKQTDRGKMFVSYISDTNTYKFIYISSD